MLCKNNKKQYSTDLHKIQDMLRIPSVLKCDKRKHRVSSLPYGPSSSSRIWTAFCLHNGIRAKNGFKSSRLLKIFPEWMSFSSKWPCLWHAAKEGGNWPDLHLVSSLLLKEWLWSANGVCRLSLRWRPRPDGTWTW